MTGRFASSQDPRCNRAAQARLNDDVVEAHRPQHSVRGLDGLSNHASQRRLGLPIPLAIQEHDPWVLVSSSSNAVDMLLIGSYEYSAITPEFRQIVHLIAPREATAPPSLDDPESFAPEGLSDLGRQVLIHVYRRQPLLRHERRSFRRESNRLQRRALFQTPCCVAGTWPLTVVPDPALELTLRDPPSAESRSIPPSRLSPPMSPELLLHIHGIRGVSCHDKTICAKGFHEWRRDEGRIGHVVGHGDVGEQPHSRGVHEHPELGAG